MDEKPKRRNVDGIDEFMLSRAASMLLKEMEMNGWNQGEVKKFPKYLEQEIKRNSERFETTKPFTVCKIS